MDQTLGVAQLVTGLGTSGVIVWILLRRHEQDRQDRIADDTAERELREKEAESRNALATALTALATKIDKLDGLPNHLSSLIANLMRRGGK